MSATTATTVQTWSVIGTATGHSGIQGITSLEDAREVVTLLNRTAPNQVWMVMED